MYVPQVRERVQLAGRSGVFLVMWVDHEQNEADLIPLHSVSSVEERGAIQIARRDSRGDAYLVRSLALIVGIGRFRLNALPL